MNLPGRPTPSDATQSEADDGGDGARPIFGWAWLQRPRARRAVWAVLAAEIITVAGRRLARGPRPPGRHRHRPGHRDQADPGHLHRGVPAQPPDQGRGHGRGYPGRTHHWVWILPALIAALRGGPRARTGAAVGYALFVLAPMWWTPHPGAGGTGQFGVHGLLTPIANCFMIAGLVFLGYMAVQAWAPRARPPDPLDPPEAGVHRRFAGRAC